MPGSSMSMLLDSSSTDQSDTPWAIIANTRVMSPTPNSGLLQGLQCLCPMCSSMTSEPTVCAYCGIYGHAICLGLQHFESYTFCAQCMRKVTQQFAEIQDANQKLDWHVRSSDQLQKWKTRAREAIGMSTSIGQAVGGAAATAAGAAVAAAQGFVNGAQSALAEQTAPPLPPPVHEPSEAVSLRRSSSAGDLSVKDALICPACDLGKHQAHTYKGSCRGLPRSVYFLSLIHI